MLRSRFVQVATLVPALTEVAQAHEGLQQHSHMSGSTVYPAVVMALVGILWAATPLLAGAIGRVRRQRLG